MTNLIISSLMKLNIVLDSTTENEYIIIPLGCINEFFKWYISPLFTVQIESNALFEWSLIYTTYLIPTPHSIQHDWHVHQTQEQEVIIDNIDLLKIKLNFNLSVSYFIIIVEKSIEVKDVTFVLDDEEKASWNEDEIHDLGTKFSYHVYGIPLCLEAWDDPTNVFSCDQLTGHSINFNSIDDFSLHVHMRYVPFTESMESNESSAPIESKFKIVGIAYNVMHEINGIAGIHHLI